MARFDIRSYAVSHIDGLRDPEASELQGDCPFDECGKEGHFYANADNGNFICFRCGRRGRGIISLVAALEGIPRREARRRLMRDFVRLRPKEKPSSLIDIIGNLRPGASSDDEKDGVDVPLPDEFVPVWDGKKWRFPKYLKARGVTREAARFFGMGFCRSGRYGGRVVLPIECPNGRSFTARDTTGESAIRYMNPRKDEGAQHGRLVFGWQSLKKGADTFIVEGPLDAVRVWQHGFPAIALLGKELTTGKASMLFGMDPGAVVVMLDPEEEAAPLEVASKLSARFSEVYVARLPDDVDPGESTKDQVMDAFVEAERYRGGRARLIQAMLRGARPA